MRLLVTGGAGFIGSNLVRLALGSGVAVTVLDDLSSGTAENLAGLDVNFVKGSVVDRAVVAAALRGVDSVVHLAAIAGVAESTLDPMASHTANASGTVNLLEGIRAAGVGHVVVASSSAVYGLNPAVPVSERDWVRPTSPYGVSKLATEQYALCYQQSFGLPTLAFRLFNVYGPGQPAGHAYAAVIPAFLDAVLNGRTVLLEGDGSQSRDFVFVRSVCEVLLDAATRQLSHPEPVNLANGTSTTVLELIDVIERVTGRRADVDRLPPRVGDVKSSTADTTLLRELFPGFQPTDLEQGIRETASWFASPVHR